MRHSTTEIMKQTFSLLPALVASALLLAPLARLRSADVALCTNGKTAFRIVKPANPSAVDDYALASLSEYLRQITGAEFPVVGADQAAGDRPGLYVGINTVVIKKLGGDPLAALQDQEHVSRSKDGDIFLFGKGVHGNLHAVIEFLEASLGWRWYSVFEKPVIPATPSVTLKPFERKRGFSFRSREVGLIGEPHFYSQNGMNMASEKWGSRPEYNFVPYLRNDKFVHSSFAYIPPTPDTVYSKSFPWMERMDYFATNPEFFSMHANGNRTPGMQLCFSNPALRQELTHNILKHLTIAPGNDIITVDAADNPDAFCYCPECKALEQKYQSPGGPIYDYLIELCGILQEQHPGKFVKTLAYRRSQTQKPPTLPAGVRLPENLIISFAPIEDCFFADWNHPDAAVQETYRDLQTWGRITSHLWAWLYPNPWGSGEVLPVGNLRRNISQMRLMHKAGVAGVFTDHRGANDRSGLSELQGFLIRKLMQDVNCDTDALILEFTDHQYGPAAGLTRLYLEELEQSREAMRELPRGVTFTPGPRFDDHIFPYLTEANIHRWQRQFDEMEANTAASPGALANVRLLRRELDFASLWKWFKLQKAYPDYFRDATVFANRIKAASPRPFAPGALADFMAMIEGGGVEKPLPAEFDGIDRSRIQTFVPTNSGRQSGPLTMKDTEAAWGYATTIHDPDMPFQMGFYQWQSRQPPKGKEGARIRLEQKDITPGKYRLYKLGSVTFTPDCWIWFSVKSWATNQQLGERLYEPGASNQWEAWVSLKFDGPTYGGTAKEDLVLCDRIIVVKKL